MRNNKKVISNGHMDRLNGKEEEIKSFLLFTMTVAVLVAVPCELVATALYSAVSLTTHLQNDEDTSISLSVRVDCADCLVENWALNLRLI